MTENGRVALVSGGNKGIGLEIVRQLSLRGFTTILGSRDEERGREAAEGLEDNVVVRQLDVTDAESVDRLASYVEEEFGRLDVLVNNAGIANDTGQRGVDADLDRVREALEANLLGAWRLCEAFVPLMQRNGYGRVVNLSSGLASLNDMGGGSPAYRVSKTGLNAGECTALAERSSTRRSMPSVKSAISSTGAPVSKNRASEAPSCVRKLVLLAYSPCWGQVIQPYSPGSSPATTMAPSPICTYTAPDGPTTAPSRVQA